MRKFSKVKKKKVFDQISTNTGLTRDGTKFLPIALIHVACIGLVHVGSCCKVHDVFKDGTACLYNNAKHKAFQTECREAVQSR